ncbi:hypothetical protein IVB14_05210 [Bradyrhizobium sp. 180]|uniref:hypothetical protein n=1 Tax=unclassified Bradyrhizobium TaxID=2631580 RepID=UPI001FF72881|nr:MULTISPECIES: hypothetical protein [unclassified Bradyrhizobium]MCK1420725.1 hypothetical protein [Bradyrhizobium sp. CW12]MCK1489836.1 hypothetical protein [Bradyrhizobium sp. 180]MCK1532380.1 hypothetical protein [Bradyrhizobium sp. 182]MCK1595656.1 hypothetical protein [Bradyrhizobium sp. 164]MCK1647322.1 hypothetical protein [Bradyrhizobium sp. 154]
MSMDVGPSGGHITGMVKIGERLHTVKTDSIYRIMLADEIDPDRTNINVPNSQQKVLDYGSDSPLVAKTLLTGKQLFEKGFLGPNFESTKAIELSFECLKNLAAMSDLATDFSRQDDNEERRLAELQIKGRSITLPSASNLEPRCKEFIQRADHALQALFAIASMFYGSKLKGWFEGLAEEVSRKHKGDSQYIGLTSDVANFCKSIRITRNCVEHRKPNERIEVSDYSLTPNNEVAPPTIAVHHPKFNQPPIPVSAYTSQVTEHIADTFEILIAFLCSRNIDASVTIPIQVVELPENQRSNKLVKYSYGMNGGNQIIPP